MTNIHIIPTDKPSRLVRNSNENTLKLCIQTLPLDKEIYCYPQHIYITNDEEIKEDVDQWYLDKVLNEPYNSGSAQYSSKQDVIIMTTDQDLIKDGVQAIDDEFLEWFVKNPSCEEVKVEITRERDGYSSKHKKWYKIIIPKEEPKQSYIKSETEFLGIEFTLKDGSKQFVPNLKEEPKQELNLNCFDCNKSLQDCTCIEDTIDMKQETLEEAASRLYPAEWDWKEKESFIEGAEWKAERSYSEEDMLQALNIGFTSTDETWEECVEFTKEQFKKK